MCSEEELQPQGLYGKAFDEKIKEFTENNGSCGQVCQVGTNVY